MTELLKTFFSPALVRRLAADIARVYPSFPARAFVGEAWHHAPIENARGKPKG